jgi:hypothetical protein
MRAHDWAVKTAKESYSRLHNNEKDYGCVGEEKVEFRIKETEIDGKVKYEMAADDVVGVPLHAFLDAAAVDAIEARTAVRAS